MQPLCRQLQDLYLNDNDLEGNIPERVVVNCEGLQRLYLGGNRLTGRVPRHLRHVRDLRELNIERNNLHGEVCMKMYWHVVFLSLASPCKPLQALAGPCKSLQALAAVSAGHYSRTLLHPPERSDDDILI